MPNSTQAARGPSTIAHWRRRASALAGAALLLGTATLCWAQEICESALRTAQRSYDLGLFEEVIAELDPCLKSRPSRSTALQVHLLRARAYFFSENLAEARQEISQILRIDSEFEVNTPPRFVALFAQVRREQQTVQVASVSKTKESLREAPATVVVVTAEQIRQRGYIDIEQLLHDLPGFDFSRSNGLVYSQIYQRGYNSFLNERSLLLIDGVEQNNLSSGGMYLSRQFAMSNIDRVEVIYGPASTMYGANAYTGVISVLTKAPEKIIPEGERFGMVANLAAGGLDTRYGELTLAGRNRSGNIAWSLGGRFFLSDEPDLSGSEGFDYTFESIDYKNIMRLTGRMREQFFNNGFCAVPSPFYVCSGQSVDLTDAGEGLVRRLDREFIAANDLGLNERNENFSLDAKLRISNFTLGLQRWRSQEGLGSSNIATFASGRTFWTPNQTAVYLKFSAPIGRALSFNAFTRYLRTGLERSSSRYEYVHTYAGGFLSLWSLVPLERTVFFEPYKPCATPFLDEEPIDCAPAKPWLESVTFGELSTQLRSEVSVVYEPSSKLSAVAGFEFAQSAIQSQPDQDSTGMGQLSAGNFEEPEQIEHTDLAVYGQASYRPRKPLKLILAGRLSYNEINNKPGASGFGALFSPRLGAIYTLPSGNVVLKAIYSEAFKDPTDQEKFSILPFVNNVRSVGLDPERVSNLELSALWEPRDGVAIEGAFYQADYEDVVARTLITKAEVMSRELDNARCKDIENGGFGCLQYQNVQEFEVRGVQLTGRYETPRARFWSNYTYTRPLQTRPENRRVAAIADHRVNFGVDVEWRDRWTGSVRTAIIGDRRVGAGTTFPQLPYDDVGSFTTTDVTVGFRDVAPGLTVQLAVRNLFNEEYFDTPGIDVLRAFPPRVRQAERTTYLLLRYDLSGSSRSRPAPAAP